MDRTDLVTQPTSAPTRKVKGTGAAGAAMLLLLVILEALGVDVPGVDGDSLAVLVPGAITAIGATVGGYLTRERA